jgi:hypothetical protein
MSVPAVTVSSMDVGVIVYCAELEAPTVRDTARRIPEAETARFVVPLGHAEVLRRRAPGRSPMHVMAAADELVRHPELPVMAQSTRQQITTRFSAELRIRRESSLKPSWQRVVPELGARTGGPPVRRLSPARGKSVVGLQGMPPAAHARTGSVAAQGVSLGGQNLAWPGGVENEAMTQRANPVRAFQPDKPGAGRSGRDGPLRQVPSAAAVDHRGRRQHLR